MSQNKTIWGIIFLMAILFIPMISAITWNNTAYYKFNETTGSIVSDSVGTYNGLAFNMENSDWISGKINNALRFGGTNEFVNTTYQKTLTGNFSLNFWFNDTSWDNSEQFGYGADALNIRGNTGDRMTSYLGNGTDTINIVGTSDVADSNWHMITFVRNTATGKYSLWVDGINQANSTDPLTGSIVLPSFYIGARDGVGTSAITADIDEFSIWERVLTTADIVQLYNSGAGLPYLSSDVIDVTLHLPLNAATISDIGNNFIASGSNISSVAGTWKNVTYYIWSSSGSLHNKTTIALNNQTFNNTLFIDDFVLGNYTWNVVGGYTNSTGLFYLWGNNNYSFSVVPFSVLKTQYNPTTIEGSLEEFYTNISIISFERMSTVNFVYNGNSYPITPIEYDTNKWKMPYNLTIPTVTSDTNRTFYWSIRLESGLIYNTTSINQTVYNIGIDNCGINTNQLFNLTMKDETNQNTLVGTTDNTSIRVSISLDSINGQIVNYSTLYNRTNPARVCINYPINTSRLYMDAVIEFSSIGRFVEYYNIRDYILTNTTQSQDIILYNLNSSVGQEYKITYKGLDFTPVSDLLIQIQRKYIDEGVFKTIEIPASGTNGYTIAHLVTNDVIYNLIFIKNGVILDSFTDVIATCQNPSFTECEINLNAAVGGTDLIGLVEEEDFFNSLSYNTATRTISSVFGITSGVAGNTTLKVYLLDNFGNTSVCSDSLIAAGGTLSCTIPSTFGNASVQAIITLDGETRRTGYISLASSPKEKYAGILVFMAIIMLLFMLGIAIQDNPMIMGVFLIVGLFILVALNMVYSTSWLGAGATALWFVIAVVMILIKGGSKR